MKVLFQSKDFASIDGSGLGFNHRRPQAASWHYQGRVQHRDWQGTYECHWDVSDNAAKSTPTKLLWVVSGDARLFGLAAALKSMGLEVHVEQD